MVVNPRIGAAQKALLSGGNSSDSTQDESVEIPFSCNQRDPISRLVSSSADVAP